MKKPYSTIMVVITVLSVGQIKPDQCHCGIRLKGNAGVARLLHEPRKEDTSTARLIHVTDKRGLLGDTGLRLAALKSSGIYRSWCGLHPFSSHSALLTGVGPKA
ncbi:hypothetical protein PoB_001264100 [Plakobranchus ocellatus]|uniref:Secreted protein n=1 Tax=Plakobranchus ocellatus TaxID=259542 RepID=A0AAV3YFM9_9GAST|nr:hypothetical protein PoB_001264100 [Plakobranchus ocellatus]